MRDDTAIRNWETDRIRVSRAEVREMYALWIKDRPYDRKLSDEDIGRQLKDVCADLESVNLRSGNGRLRHYQFLPLAVCRKEFEERYSQSFDWGE